MTIHPPVGPDDEAPGAPVSPTAAGAEPETDIGAGAQAVMLEGLLGQASQGGTGLASILGEDFSPAKAIGGWRGVVESGAPGLVFVVVFVASRALAPALIASAGIAIVLTVIRLIQRTPVTQALGGLIGVAIGVWWAWQSGKGENYFLWALLLNAGYGLACLVSILVRWPVVGLIVGAFADFSLTAWRSRPEFYRRSLLGTWLLVAMFALRLAVKTPLYLGEQVGWLGTAHLIMGVPLYALTLWTVWLLLRGHIRE